MKSKHIITRVTPEQHAKIKKIANKEGFRLGEFIRIKILEYIRETKK